MENRTLVTVKELKIETSGVTKTETKMPRPEQTDELPC